MGADEVSLAEPLGRPASGASGRWHSGPALNLDDFTSALGSEIEKIRTKLTPESQRGLEEESRQRFERFTKLIGLQCYDEQKAKRWEAIKSKAFRRAAAGGHRRGREKAPLPRTDAGSEKAPPSGNP
jgi:hypothetical protein